MGLLHYNEIFAGFIGQQKRNRSFYVHPKRASTGQAFLHKLYVWERVSVLLATHNSLSSGMHRPTRWLRNSYHSSLYKGDDKPN